MRFMVILNLIVLRMLDIKLSVSSHTARVLPGLQETAGILAR